MRKDGVDQHRERNLITGWFPKPMQSKFPLTRQSPDHMHEDDFDEKMQALF